jgi:uncharacterized membrane protein HdeD (DUF308 family)
MSTSVNTMFKHAYGWSVTLAILLMICGLLAIALPISTSFGVVIVIGWLVLFGGLAQVFHAFQSEGVGHILWKLLVAAFYIATGGYLLTHPILGIAGLTLALAVFFFAEGAVDVIAYFAASKTSRSVWMLIDGIIAFAVCLMIWKRWPYNALWVIGVLAGVSMLMTGITRLMMVLAIRKLARDQGESFLRRAA